MINIGLLGCGYWGQNLARNLSLLKSAKLKTICDMAPNRIEYIKKQFPDSMATDNAEDLLSDNTIDGIVVALPVKDHFNYAKKILERGKHVLVEKPLCTSSKEGEELLRIADKNKKVLMVGHTFEYNAAVVEVKKYFRENILGNPYYIYSQRLNLGIVRQDVNAMWNLAPHDVSIILSWIGKMPKSVSARGASYLQKGVEDIAFMTLEFPGGELANIHVSWLDPSKVRRMTVVGSKKMVVYDDVSEDEKIQIFDKGIDVKHIHDNMGSFETFAQFQLIKRVGDKIMPKINFVEPLRVECDEFVRSIESGSRPLTDGENGLRVVRVLEACQKSLSLGGGRVDLS